MSREPRLTLLAMLVILCGTGRSPWSRGMAADAAAPPAPFDVWSVASSQDGKIIVAGGGLWEQPGEIGIWDAAYRPLKRFAEDRGIASVAVSPDGKLLASGGWDGHVRIRDWAAGTQAADFEIGSVARVAFSPAGDLLATAAENQTVQLWDVARGQHVADLEGDPFRFHCVVFSPDGKHVLAGGGDWKPGGIAQVNVWDVANKQLIQKLTGHTLPILTVTFSHDGKLIATASIDQTIRLWNATTGRCLKTLTGHSNWVESVAFSPDDKTLVSGGHDRTIRFWNVEKGTETGRIAAPAMIRTVQFMPDGQRVLAGGVEKLFLVFDAVSHKQLAVLWNRIPAPTLPTIAMEQLPPTNVVDVRHRGWLTAALIGAMVIGLCWCARVILRRSQGGDPPT